MTEDTATTAGLAAGDPDQAGAEAVAAAEADQTAADRDQRAAEAVAPAACPAPAPEPGVRTEPGARSAAAGELTAGEPMAGRRPALGFSDGWEVSAASAADIPAWVDLVESAYRGDSSRAGWTTEADLLGGNRMNAAIAAQTLAAPATTVLLLRDSQGAAVGSVQLVDEGGGMSYFGLFAVSPTLQGTGLGTALMRHAQDWARGTWGATAMRMTVISRREDLIAYYRRKGWELTGRTEPFPYGQPEVGHPKVDDLEFVELVTQL